MCTLTWQRQQHELYLCFNRDEHITRPIAIPPSIHQWQDSQVIAAIDPQGGGTWLCVNETGLIIALLNLYNEHSQNTFTLSRGQLVKQLSAAEDVAAAEALLALIEFEHFAPFQLMLIDPTTQAFICWNGKESLSLMCPTFATSSSIETDAVISARLSAYKALNSEHLTQNHILCLHQSHNEHYPIASICAHRALSKTVSLSEIYITTDNIRYRYFDGSPCQFDLTQPSTIVTMPIITKRN